MEQIALSDIYKRLPSCVSVSGTKRIMRGCHRRDEVRNDVGCRKDHGVEMCYCDAGRDRERAQQQF